MFIELVDALRCLTAHEETWLVAAVTRMDGRHIIDGKLGCPVCRREYTIRDGVAWFTTDEPSAARLTHQSTSADEAHRMRTGALLGLIDGGGIVALSGSWTDGADQVAELGPAHVVLLNASAPNARAQEVSSLMVDSRLPFGSGSLRAVALDSDLASPETLSSAAAVLATKGRLVAPARAPVPEDLTELARDAQIWVAERTAVAAPPIQLRSAKR